GGGPDRCSVRDQVGQGVDESRRRLRNASPRPATSSERPSATSGPAVVPVVGVVAGAAVAGGAVVAGAVVGGVVVPAAAVVDGAVVVVVAVTGCSPPGPISGICWFA